MSLSLNSSNIHVVRLIHAIHVAQPHTGLTVLIKSPTLLQIPVKMGTAKGYIYGMLVGSQIVEYVH